MEKPTRQEEFMMLYDPVHTQFLRYCEVLTRDAELAKDLVSEVVLAAYEKLHTLKKKESFLYFLFGIARNTHLKHIRKSQKMTRFNGTEQQVEGHQRCPEKSADVVLLYEALERLPEKTKEALVLFEIVGFSLKEVQQIQGGTLSGVKVRLKRGREKLKQELMEKSAMENR